MKSTIDRKEKYCTYQPLEENLLSTLAPQLKADLVSLNNEGYRNIILNLQSVKFIDSSGLSAVLIGYRLCRDAKGHFILTGLGDSVQKLIKISQLDTILSVTPSLAEAVDMIMLEEMEREIKDMQ